MTYDLNGYRFRKSNSIETGLPVGHAFFMNACILQPVFDAICTHTTSYSADVAYDILSIQEQLRKMDDADITGREFVHAMGVREMGVDWLQESDLMQSSLHNDYIGGIFVFRVSYDPERKMTCLMLDEYEKTEEASHAED